MKIVDAHIIDEENYDLSDGGRSFAEVIAGGIDNLTKGAKATLVTEALIFADVVKDRNAMRTIAGNNQAALNAYFDNLNYEKLVKSNDEVIKGFKEQFMDQLRKNTPIFIAGSALGVIGTAIYSKKKKKS